MLHEYTLQRVKQELCSLPYSSVLLCVIVYFIPLYSLYLWCPASSVTSQGQLEMSCFTLREVLIELIEQFATTFGKMPEFTDALNSIASILSETEVCRDQNCRQGCLHLRMLTLFLLILYIT